MCTFSWQLKGGVVTAQITTQNEAVKNAIETQVVQLKDNLEEQGCQRLKQLKYRWQAIRWRRILTRTDKIIKVRSRTRQLEVFAEYVEVTINLNLYNSDEEALEEAGGLDDAARIAMEMMTANGNTMDLLA